MNTNSNAVAKNWMKPIVALRPPSPALGHVMPMRGLPGSPSNAVATVLLKPIGEVRPICERHLPRDAHDGRALVGPGQATVDAHADRAGLPFHLMEVT